MNTLVAPLIQVEAIVKSYGSRRILDGINFTVEQGEQVAIVGPSGAGKTSLLRCIAGIDGFDSGAVRFDQAIATRQQIGFVFQKLNDLWDHMTLLRNVALPRQIVFRETPKEAQAVAESLLVRFGLHHCLHSKPIRLSGGEYQRAKIARSLAVEPRILLLDEVTSALDPELIGDMLEVIADLAAEGRTMIFVSHELFFVRRVANRVVFMNEGRIEDDGPPDEILRNPQSRALKRFLDRFSKWGGSL